MSGNSIGAAAVLPDRFYARATPISEVTALLPVAEPSSNTPAAAMR